MWNIDLRITETGVSLNIICKDTITGFIIMCQKPSDLLCFGSIKLHFPKALALQLHSKRWMLRPNLYVTQKIQILNHDWGFVEAKCWFSPAKLCAGFSGNLNCVSQYWGTGPMHSISFNTKLLVNHSLDDVCTRMEFSLFWINYANSAVFTNCKLVSYLNSME